MAFERIRTVQCSLSGVQMALRRRDRFHRLDLLNRRAGDQRLCNHTLYELGVASICKVVRLTFCELRLSFSKRRSRGLLRNSNRQLMNFGI